MNHPGSLLRTQISRFYSYKSKVGLEICISTSSAVKLTPWSTEHTLRDTSTALVAFSHVLSFLKICLRIFFSVEFVKLESHWWKTLDQLCWDAPGSSGERGDKTGAPLIPGEPPKWPYVAQATPIYSWAACFPRICASGSL